MKTNCFIFTAIKTKDRRKSVNEKLGKEELKRNPQAQEIIKKRQITDSKCRS